MNFYHQFNIVKNIPANILANKLTNTEETPFALIVELRCQALEEKMLKNLGNRLRLLEISAARLSQYRAEIPLMWEDISEKIIDELIKIQDVGETHSVFKILKNHKLITVDACISVVDPEGDLLQIKLRFFDAETNKLIYWTRNNVHLGDEVIDEDTGDYYLPSPSMIWFLIIDAAVNNNVIKIN